MKLKAIVLIIATALLITVATPAKAQPLQVGDRVGAWHVNYGYGEGQHAVTGGFHRGVDLIKRVGQIEGSPLYAPYDAEIECWQSRTAGNAANIPGDSIVIQVHHLQSYCQSGHYRQGEMFGQVGNTGSMTTGPHLHLQIHDGNWQYRHPSRHWAERVLGIGI